MKVFGGTGRRNLCFHVKLLKLKRKKKDFLCQKSSEFKKETIFCWKHYFLATIWEPLYLLKSCPIFDEPSFINEFLLLSMLILGQKSCFLGPTIFEIPQPNWYYCWRNYIKKQTYFFTWLQTEHETVSALIMNSYHLCVESANKIYTAPSQFIYLTYNDRTHLINLTKWERSMHSRIVNQGRFHYE